MTSTRAVSEKVLDRRISSLESKLSELKKKKLAILQSRLRDAQIEVSEFETDVTGKRAGYGAGASRTAPAGRRGKGGPRGPRLSEGEVVSRLAAEVKAAGEGGISAREAAKRAGVFYLRAIKVMDGNFKKAGSGKWTRYRIK